MLKSNHSSIWLLSAFCMAMICYAPDAQAQRGLIAHYKFNYDREDYSGNRNHGLIIGTVDYTEDRFGNRCSALGLGGSSFFQVPSSSSLNSPTNKLTIAAWVRSDFGGNNNPALMWFTICAKGNTSSETDNIPQYRLQMSSRTISINTEFTENYSSYISPGVWYHCAVVYDGGTVILYINGQQVFSYPYSGILQPNDQPLEIGRDMPGSTEYQYGAIDDVMIYRKALDPSEIQAIYSDHSEKGGNGVNCGSAPVAINTKPIATNTPAITTPSAISPPVVVSKVDTVYQNKTVTQTKIDTVYKRQVVSKVDTVYQNQTVSQTKVDTVVKRRVVYQDEVDTVRRKKVVYVTDTVFKQAPKFSGSFDPSKDTYRLEKVYFEQGTDKLIPSSYDELNDLSKAMESFPTLIIRLDGHTDNQGNYTQNVKLSLNRVNKVKEYLVKRGVDTNRIQVKAFGPSKPINDNSSEALRKLNRRVEVSIIQR